MRPQVISKSLAAASVNAIALAQALVAAGNLVLNGASATAGVATLDTQRRVSILSSGNDSALTWTVTGTLGSGAPISETVAGGNAVAVATLQDFKTVTKIAANGATAGTVQVGTNNTGSTPWIMPSTYMAPFEIGFEGEVTAGAATWSVETTQNSPLPPLPIYQPGFDQTPPVPTAFGAPGLTNQIGNAQGAVSGTVIAAWRLTITAGTGTVRVTAIQSGLLVG